MSLKIITAVVVFGQKYASYTGVKYTFNIVHTRVYIHTQYFVQCKEISICKSYIYLGEKYIQYCTYS